MWKKHIGIIIITLIASTSFWLSSCEPAPDFPVTPAISFQRFEFREIQGSSLDSLIFYINFQDGDGDLGLQNFENFPPYHEFSIYVDPITRDTLKYGDNDTLPAFNCQDYEILRRDRPDNIPLIDTLYVIRNPNHNNFFVDFLFERDGEFVVYNWALERCTKSFHDRFPLLTDSPGRRPVEGVLRYGIRGGFRLLFRNDLMKLRVSIQDRALNRSNIIETEPFRIEDIIRPPS
ncbi:MAG: hypothetical protein ACFCUU_13435 [Cyclobacteriaceae bacterium]